MKIVDPSTASPGRIRLRRLLLAVLTLTTVAVASYEALQVLLLNGFHKLEWPILPLFIILVLPIALSFWTAVIGFFVLLRGSDDLALERIDTDKNHADLSHFRTAIVIPAYNEDAVRLYAGIKATYESLERTGHLRRFDLFLLSDTTDPDIWIREELAFHDLQSQVSDPARLIYRNRRKNSERKSGNIADFCATWGEEYRYMIVFDADSLMAGNSLVRLVDLMERHPTVGILQTPPVAVNRESFFGRILQFSTRAYGPMFIAGLNYWLAGESNYWGHNAIIRIRPFVEHCRLPVLSGKEPLGGSILSHDFVEAALMRRAGWKVYLAVSLGGSYEEIPANLIGHAARDRRWCQGNLQHLRLLRMPGLNWMSRIHLLLGVMSYAAAPIWMLMVLFSTADCLMTAFFGHAYFHPDQSPFPVWQVSMAGKAVVLMTSVLSMLLLPKLLSLLVWLLKKRGATAGFGGGLRLTASVIMETLFSVLLAPVLAVLHSRFVISTLCGSKVSWAAQDRGDAETPWLQAIRWHLGIMALGVGWAALLWFKDRELLWWLTPILAGWVLSIPFSVWSSKIKLGRWTKKHGLFLTPEEVWPPHLLRAFHQEMESVPSRPWAKDHDGLEWVLADRQVRSIHLSLLSELDTLAPLARHRLEGLRLKVCAEGAAALKPAEKRELLWDPESIQALAREIHHDDQLPASTTTHPKVFLPSAP